MKANIIDLQGSKKEEIKLPKVFNEPIREDLIKRAVLVIWSNKRQPYGSDKMAGKRTSAHYHGYRRHRYTMMNKEMARLPRLHGKTVPFLNMTARFVTSTRGGRTAHAPLVEKIWKTSINNKEKRKAINSAIAATAESEILKKRGHRIGNIEVPIVVIDDLQKITKTKNLKEFLIKIGLEKEIERITKRKIRAGKGKLRGRKYKNKVGPLFIISNDEGIGKAVKNISGSNVCRVENLSTEYLAPGAKPGRLTIFTKSAIEKLGE